VLWFLNSIFFSLARSSTLASALSSVLLKASRKSKLLNVCHKSQSRNVPATYPLKVKGKNSTSQVLGILLRAASATAAAVSYASALKKKNGRLHRPLQIQDTASRAFLKQQLSTGQSEDIRRKNQEDNHLTHHIRSLPHFGAGNRKGRNVLGRGSIVVKDDTKGSSRQLFSLRLSSRFDKPLRPIPLALQPPATFGNVASLVDLPLPPYQRRHQRRLNSASPDF
jgi:hypothetical protein